jgi:hypothetical protein
MQRTEGLFDFLAGSDESEVDEGADGYLGQGK